MNSARAAAWPPSPFISICLTLAVWLAIADSTRAADGGTYLGGGISSCAADALLPYAFRVDTDGRIEISCETPTCFSDFLRSRSVETVLPTASDDAEILAPQAMAPHKFDEVNEFDVRCDARLTDAACSAPAAWTSAAGEWTNGTHILLRMRCCRVSTAAGGALPLVVERRRLVVRAGEAFRGGAIAAADGYDYIKEIRKSVTEANEVLYVLTVLRMECTGDSFRSEKSKAEKFYEENRDSRHFGDRIRPSASMLRQAMLRRLSGHNSSSTYLHQMKTAAVAAQKPSTVQGLPIVARRQQRPPLIDGERRRHPPVVRPEDLDDGYDEAEKRRRAIARQRWERRRAAAAAKRRRQQKPQPPGSPPSESAETAESTDEQDGWAPAHRRQTAQPPSAHTDHYRPSGSPSSEEQSLWPVRFSSPLSSRDSGGAGDGQRLFSAGESFKPENLQNVDDGRVKPSTARHQDPPAPVPIDAQPSGYDVPPSLPSETHLQHIIDEVDGGYPTGVTPLSNNPSPAIQEGYQTLNNYVPPTQLLSVGSSDGSVAAYAPQPSQYAVDDGLCPTACAQPLPYCVSTPAQPCCCAAAASPSLQCFSGDMTVMTRDSGRKRVDQLRVGEYVMALENSTVGFSPVVMFLHRKPRERAVYRQLMISDGRILKLTDFHLIYMFECKPSALAVTPPRLVQARRLRVGDCVYALDAVENALQPAEIVGIDKVHEVGIYAPLTASGDIIVSEILASCHSNVAAQTLQQTFFLLWHTLDNCVRRVSSTLFGWAKSSFIGAETQNDKSMTCVSVNASKLMAARWHDESASNFAGCHTFDVDEAWTAEETEIPFGVDFILGALDAIVPFSAFN